MLMTFESGSYRFPSLVADWMRCCTCREVELGRGEERRRQRWMFIRAEFPEENADSRKRWGNEERRGEGWARHVAETLRRTRRRK